MWRHDIITAMLQDKENIKDVKSGAFKGLMNDYEKFREETRSGKHGGTAQLWFLYISLMEWFLLMKRAVKINDTELFTYGLKTTILVFFASHEPNYSWNNNEHGLRTSWHTWSAGKGSLCCEVFWTFLQQITFDQAVEMTVNVDAASGMIAISAFPESPCPTKMDCHKVCKESR